MLFNSFEFLIFLPIVFTVYWFVLNHNLKLQNLFMIAAGYVFYGWWDWRFLSLLIFSSTFDYLLGLRIYYADSKRKSKIFLITSIIINLGLLGIFKYYNFFVDSFVELFMRFGIHLDKRSINVILPVGISFYTFQSMSYTIDLYWKKLKPTTDIIAYFAFVSFFPQLLAGPIERARNMLPQFLAKRSFDFDKAQDGMRQILWGLFKKVVIADNLSPHVEKIFGHYHQYGGSTLLIGVFYFAIQIYCDFSGYSDMAIGLARLFGFNLMRNFAFPYFSRDIAEFWRRWHISLSTWFRDYLYIPLGGSRGSKWLSLRNVILVFTISGFWHGANWTFIVWGFFNGLLFVPLSLLNLNKQNLNTVAEGRLLPSIKEAFQMGLTFFLTLIAWVFFRSVDITNSFQYLGHMFSASLFEIPSGEFKSNFIFIILLLVIEWFQRNKQHALQIDKIPVFARWITYYALILLIFNKGGHQATFIYFQF
jgi:alginate O-acetyltransferase complex protein AlgI